MANVRVRWIDSLSAAATGTKVFRNDVEIADIANGIQEYIDTAAPDDATPKYEVQAHDGAGDETTQEVLGENMDYIDTTAAPVAPDAPTVLAAGTPTDTTIPLTWVQSATGAMTNYRVYIGGVLQQTFGDVAAGTLTGLTAETLYSDITVRAWDGVTESADSNAVSGTTEASPIGGVGSYVFDADPANQIDTTFPVFSLPGDFTSVVRIKATSSGAATARTLYSAGGTYNFFAGLTAGNGLDIRLRGGGSDIARVVANIGLSDDAIHTVAISYQVAGGVLIAYVDGLEVGSFPGYTHTGQENNGDNLLIGEYAFNEPFNGDFQIVQMYNQVLTPAEILALETDINAQVTGKIADYNSVKSSTVWTENISGANGAVAPSVTYVP